VVSDEDRIGKVLDVRGLSSLGLQSPVKRSELGGGVTTLGTFCTVNQSPSTSPDSKPLQCRCNEPMPLRPSARALTHHHDSLQRNVKGDMVQGYGVRYGLKTNGASACGKIGYHIVGTECATWSVFYRCLDQRPLIVPESRWDLQRRCTL
jgi:hypothetical protein